MKSHLALGVLVFAAIGAPTQAHAIRNGTPTDSAQYRGVGRLLSVNLPRLTATLISRDAILTNAQNFPYTPATPLLGTWNTPGTAHGVALSGSRAYVADRALGFEILDVSNPASPTLLGSYNTSGVTEAVSVSGNTACVADGSFGLQIFDVTNPTSIRPLGIHGTPDWASDVVLVGTTAYVAVGTAGLMIVDIGTPATPVQLGLINTPGVARAVAVSGTTAYVADDLSGLEIIDVSNPASPVLRGTYNTPGTALGVAVSGTTAYVADGASGLEIVDVTNPSAPTLLGSFDTPGTASWVELGATATGGTAAYVADGAAGLLVVDVSDPAAPTPLMGYDTPDFAYGLAVSGTTAYVADGTSGLQILDARMPEFVIDATHYANVRAFVWHPDWINFLGQNPAFDVAVAVLDSSQTKLWTDLPRSGVQTTFVAAGSDGIAIGYGETGPDGGEAVVRRSGTLNVTGHIDGSDPFGNVIPHAMLETVPSSNGLNQMICPGDQGGPLYIGGAIAGIASFRFVGACGDPGPGYFVALDRFTSWITSTLAAIDPGGGVVSVDRTPPTGALAEITAAPNPVLQSAQLSFTLAAAGATHLDVFDAAGRRVRNLESGTLSAGPHSVEWNRRDDEGRLVGPGVYFVRLTSNGPSRLVRVVTLQ